ncbi:MULTISPECIES: replication protein RepA [Gammaproteobacteria]|jgi:hypothetical protein|uniref:Plasmid encoded RepA protein n=4 Tax=Gammaproteobacteria TaxID=1236 RepID=A0A432ZT39_9GAMM|nr:MULTISPECIES: replication protein RepA [Gammaproteobacteria]MCZ4128800.1 replication protein RepA [Stutzerimonas balearica]ONF44489.1 hypothetical protein BTO32_05770 [Marinobacter lutaoensis]RUO81022.1 hypothetical protein CWI84_02600 [Idiomarina tyrosinivorans]BCB72102.1 hypothetical protein HMEPL2_24530 [Halomonas meridiana]GGG58932.1 hypothetical protein GCM10011403_15380 [Pseudohongiella nitratireducens]
MGGKPFTAYHQSLIEQAENQELNPETWFMPQLFCQLSPLPAANTDKNLFQRTNGNVKVSVLSSERVPAGGLVRLLLAWLTTQAKRQRSPELAIDTSQSQFLKSLGLSNSGRYAALLREQVNRLARSTFQIERVVGNGVEIENILVSRKALISMRHGKNSSWSSTISLDEEFYQSILSNAVPVSAHAIKALTKNPLAIDFYCWWNWRVHSMSRRRQIEIPLDALKLQFSSETKERRDFRRKLENAAILASIFHHEIFNSTLFQSDKLIITKTNPHIAPK